MAYKLKPHHKNAILNADQELVAANLPTYSKVLALLIKLEQDSRGREAIKTRATAKIHTEVLDALDAFKP
jgi:hypothetical protein